MENVTRIEQKKENTVYEDIMSFLDEVELKSENTRIAYETDIRQFFQFMLNKKIEDLTLEDLKFRHAEIVRYKVYLAEKYSATTVNRKIASLRSLFVFLEKNYPEHIKSAVFKVDKMREVNVRHSGTLTWEEVLQMIELAKKEYKGRQKALLIELATITGIRLGALLNLRWSDIKKINGYWVIEVIDKGEKKDEKPISEELYERLSLLKYEKRKDKDKVFELSRKTVESMMKRLTKKMGIDPERNITFHSFKHTGIAEVWKVTGDIMAVAQYGNHSNPTTTLKWYMEQQKDYSKMGSLLIGKRIKIKIIEDLSKEQLVDIIKNCNRGVQLEILRKGKELGYIEK